MSLEESPAQKAAREQKELDDELKRQQKDAEKDTEVDDDHNLNNNDNSNSGGGDVRQSQSRREKNGMSDLEDEMDGLSPLGNGNKNNTRKDITGKKRTFMSTSDQIHHLTQRLIDKDISEENYMTILHTLTGDMGSNGSKTSKGSKARRGNGKRSSAVRQFLIPFIFCLRACVCFVFSFLCVLF